jgi:methylisocitrate lyase
MSTLSATELNSAGARFRAALAAEKPLQIIGAINAYHAMLAKQTGYKALYLSGGGVAAGSLGLPDLGISTLEDVLIDVRRITDAVETPLLVDIDTGFGGAFNIARTVKSVIKAGAAAVHIEDQVSEKRCGHRPNKAVVSQAEMVDRVKLRWMQRLTATLSSWRVLMRWRLKVCNRRLTVPVLALKQVQT